MAKPIASFFGSPHLHREVMFQDTISLAAMADALSRSDDYLVLRRLIPRLPSTPSTGQDTRTAVLLDPETAGLDARKDEILRTRDGQIRLFV